MQSVIGLLRFEADPRSSIGELKEAGFDETEIRLLTQTSAIRKLFDCDPVCVVVRYTAWGAALGIAIYGLFGLLAGWCE